MFGANVLWEAHSSGEHVWRQSYKMSTSKVMFDANILWEAQLVSMFGASLTKCQLLSHVWRQSYKMSTSDVNFYSNFGANFTKCQLLNISIHIGQYQYWGLLRYWQYQYIHSSSIVLPNMG